MLIDFQINGRVTEHHNVSSSLELIDSQKGDTSYINARVKDIDAYTDGPLPYNCLLNITQLSSSSVNTKRWRIVPLPGGSELISLGEVRYLNGGGDKFDMNPTVSGHSEWTDGLFLQQSFGYSGTISTPDLIESISFSNRRPSLEVETSPGFEWVYRVKEDCALGYNDNSIIFRKFYNIKGSVPVDVSVLAPSEANFGPVTLGSEKSLALPIQVTTNGPVSYDLFLRADKPQIGGTGLIGSGSYRIDLPADLGGGSADLSGTTGIPLVAAGEGVTTINSNITLSVPDNADVGQHSANLTVTIRQK